MTTEQKITRKLRAILSADVKGYSLLMTEDEAHTIKTLKEYRNIMSGIITQHSGRVVDAPGDNLLAEFSSVVNAVQCSVEIQKELKERNADLPVDKRLEFRIGVNIGDVVQDGDSLYGEGVNIAARIEGLADPGGVCISRGAYDHIRNKLKLGYEFIGEHSVKNIKNPVRVYKVLMEPKDAGKLIGGKPALLIKNWIWSTIVVAAIILTLIGYKLYHKISAPEFEPAFTEKIAPPLPEKPSIAVLPFDNMSNDPNQEYFCDGITEDIITDLSKLSGLFVISRNSVFLYKGKAVKPSQVSRELGVRYILEGSVRKVDDTIRINAQLIDSTTNGHLWAERYDGKINNIFSMQDNVTRNIIKALQVRLTKDEQEKTAHADTDSIEAYNTFLKGWRHYVRYTAEDFSKALIYFKKAVEIDPGYSRAYAALALIHKKAVDIGYQGEMGFQWDKAQLMPLQYLKLAMRNPSALALNVAAELYLKRHQYKEAFLNANHAIELNPNDPESQIVMAKVLIMGGKSEEAFKFVKKATLLDPHNKARSFYMLGLIRFSMGHLEEAVNLFGKAHALIPKAYLWSGPLAASYAHLGKNLKAKAAIENFIKFCPYHPMLTEAMFYFPFKDHTVANRLAAGLLKAGLKSKTSRYIKVSEEDRLSGEEIRQLLFGRVRIGFRHDLMDTLIREEISENGKSTKRDNISAVGDNEGTIWIENDILCDRYYDLYQAGLERCGPIFRNPNGTEKLKNEYVWITDLGLWEWSIENQ